MTKRRHGLTRRQWEVMRLVATGASNKEIALSMQIESRTVQAHLSQIMSRQGASSRTECVYLLGWITIPLG